MPAYNVARTAEKTFPETPQQIIEPVPGIAAILAQLTVERAIWLGVPRPSVSDLNCGRL